MTIKDRIHILEKEFGVADALPVLETNIWDFMKYNAPKIGRRDRQFHLTPQWEQPFLDNHPNKCFVCGRQTRKTSYGAIKIAHRATTKEGVEVCMCLDDDLRLGVFSKQRLREDVFNSNPEIKAYLPHGGRAAVNELKLNNGSVIYPRTDENGYYHVQGLSLDLFITDESQYHEWESISKALYTLTETHGWFESLGIGGEQGSPWEERWLSSDQHEWHYETDTDYTDPSTGRVWPEQGWRKDLVFDVDGQIIEDDLDTILKGHWIPKVPEHTEVRGYHMPQNIFATIPLTIHDAVNKYHIPSWLSIEWQEKHQPPSIFLSHSPGLFYKAERRPLTPEMVRKCMMPYQWLTLLTPQQVRQYKNVYSNQVMILGGIDFGSSISMPTTVLSIILHWRKTGRYQLAWIEKIPQEDHPLDKARKIVTCFLDYGIDIGVGDIGHGQDMIPIIQAGGRDSHDVPFQGLGRSKFYACRTTGDETKPQIQIQQDTDEKGTELGRLQIDKTTIIQEFIDFIGWHIPVADLRQPWLMAKPTESKSYPKFMIPYKNDWETDWLVKDFCAIVRKDLEEEIGIEVQDPRKFAKKEFNHPRDSTMSIIYCLIGDKYYDPSAYRILPVRRRK